MDTSSQVLSVICLIIAYFYLFSDKYEEQSSLQKFNQELLDLQLYPSVLEMALVAASSGLNFFTMPTSLSEDCIRTAAVVMHLFAQPSTSRKMAPLLSTIFSKVSEDVHLDKTLQDSVEQVSKILNEISDEFDFVNLEELKRAVKVPKPSKNSLLQIEGDQMTFDSVRSSVGLTDNPEFLKYLVVSCFQMSIAERSDTSNVEEYASISEAIDQLAQLEAFKSTVDSEFIRVLEDYIETYVLGHSHPHKAQLVAISNSVFAKKVDYHFLKDSALAEEYAKIKKVALDKYITQRKSQPQQF